MSTGHQSQGHNALTNNHASVVNVTILKLSSSNSGRNYSVVGYQKITGTELNSSELYDTFLILTSRVTQTSIDVAQHLFP